MSCTSCQENNHVVPTVTGTVTTNVPCECACGCSEPVCPTPQPCTEITDSKCVIYTGDVLQTNISVEQALEQLATTGVPTPGANIAIPNLKVGALRGKVYAALDFYDNEEWKNHNPRIFLFRTKKIKAPGSNFIGRPSQFVHTTHLNGGSGSKWFKGSLAYRSTEGGHQILRHTEFPIPNFLPYQKFDMSFLGLNPYEWITYMTKTQDCATIEIALNSNLGYLEQIITASGTVNGQPQYVFNYFGMPYEIIYWPVIGKWILHHIGDPIGNYSAELAVGATGCPVDNTQPWGLVNLQSGGVTFSFVGTSIFTQINKRQALFSDISQYQAQKSIGDSSLTWIEQGYCFLINQKNAGGLNMSKQKIHFKLAIVIDNPNATPDKPYLIGPMSDAFVLRFTQDINSSCYAKFTNDYILKNLT